MLADFGKHVIPEFQQSTSGVYYSTGHVLELPPVEQRQPLTWISWHQLMLAQTGKHANRPQSLLG